MNRPGNKQRIIMFVLVTAAVFFSIFRLTESPPVWYDEGWYIQTAHNLEDVGIDGIQLAPSVIEHVSNLTVGYPLIYPLAGWLKILGNNVFAARSLMIVFILGFILFACYLVRRVWNTEIALGVFALLATLPTLYGNGKSVLGEVPGLFYLVLFLWFFYNATASSQHKRPWLLLAAFFAGICVVTKPLFILLIPAIAIAVMFECKHKLLKPLDVLYGILIGLIPVLGWVMIQFKGADSLSSVLTFYANPYEIQNLSQVIAQNAKRLFTDMGTLYLSVAMILWIGSLSIRVKIKEKIPGVEMIGFIFSLLVILAFLRTAGWYRYLFPAQTIVLIFLPYTLYFLANHTGNAILKKAVPVVIAILAVFGIYQLTFDSWVADSYKSTRTASWEQYFDGMPSANSIFFYNTPEVAIFAPHRNYYQYIEAASIKLGERYLPVIAQKIPSQIIAETDAYRSNEQTLFEGYRVGSEIEKYSILVPK